MRSLRVRTAAFRSVVLAGGIMLAVAAVGRADDDRIEDAIPAGNAQQQSQVIDL
ncbi:MAG: hypothetical protein RLZZ21_2645, partial [Planctomycetota bacterium]